VSRGRLVLVGSGEFTPAMAPVDRELLVTFPGHAPRVVIAPTASAHDGTAETWAERGIAHFRQLGLDVTATFVLHEDDALDDHHLRDAEAAEWVYFSGGSAGHLRDVLAGSPFWATVRERYESGLLLAGASAGAMVLGERMCDPLTFDERGAPLEVTIRDGLGLLPRTVVVPHFDRYADIQTRLASWPGLFSDGLAVLGIDEDTALLESGDRWLVRGAGRVVVHRSPREARAFRSGSDLPRDATEAFAGR
jgi:cyanophycinase